MQSFFQLPDPSILIVIASALFTLGYLIINQFALRLTMLAGSTVYIAYYATVASHPLWGAIYSSLVMMTANLLGFAALYARNAPWLVRKDQRGLLADFAPLAPGDFRALMRLANRRLLTVETALTIEGETPSAVYFILSGHAEISKYQGAAEFKLPPRVFVGEVAYLLGAPSAATTTLAAGAEVLVWPRDKLQRAMRRKPRLRLAFDAAISRDMARKVALAIAPANY